MGRKRNRHVTKAVLVAALVISLLALAACGGGGTVPSAEASTATASATAPATVASTATTSATAANEDLYIAAFAKNFTSVFWQRIEQGMQAACDEYGARLTYEAPAAGDQAVNQQVEQIEAAIGRNPSAILISAVDAVAVGPAIDEADEAGIPVFTFNSDASSDKVKAYYGTSNFDGGRLAAEKMAEILGGTGKVAIVAVNETSNSGKERRDGFIEYMTENCPDIEIVDIQYNADDPLKATEICSAFLLSYEDLAGIYAASQTCSEGLARAIQENEMIGEIAAIGFDSGQAVIDAVRAGVLNGAISQDPYNQGYMSAKAALEYVVNGVEPAEYKNDTGCAFYNAQNIDSEEIQRMLYT